MSHRFARVIAAGALSLLAVCTSARQPADAPDFRFERPIAPGDAGARRLAIDVPLLTGGSPFQVEARPSTPSRGEGGETSYQAVNGLRDLRLFDASGREIAYVFVRHPSPEPAWKTALVLPVAAVDTSTLRTSGFEADLGDAYVIDRFRIDRLAPPFLKRVRLEGSGDRAHWTLLVPEGTVFDLPDERLHQTELPFRPGSYRYLRVTWDDTHSGRVPTPPLAVARMVAAPGPPPQLTAGVQFERRPSEPGRSRFRIRLPGGHLPVVALDLDVAGAHVLRDATVLEGRLAGSQAVPVELGRSTLRRIEMDTVAAASLRVPIAPPTEADLSLVVDDGDNPPLDLRGVTAIFAELPWIYFEHDGGALVARYGNATLRQPRYDLEALRGTLQIENVADASWRDARPLADNAAGAAPPLPIVGRSLDTAIFRYLRTIPAGNAGFVAVPLDAAVLAHSAGAAAGFGDVRVIDGDGRQIPYLTERVPEPLSIELQIERLPTLPRSLASRGAARSVYRIRWPFARLPSPRLVLTTSARVFDRRMTVAIDREPEETRRDPLQTVASAEWVNADRDRPAPALTLGLPLINAKEVLLVVEDGDNAPLPIAAARLLLPAYRLRFFRTRGAALRLAYGRDDLNIPHYDLALLAPQLLGVPATELTAGNEPPAPAGGSTAALVSPRLSWVALTIAVIVLIGVIVRLVRDSDRAPAA